MSLTLYMEHSVDSLKLKIQVGKEDVRIITADDCTQVPMQTKTKHSDTL